MLLEAVIQHRGLWRENGRFPGLSEIMAAKITAAMPRCDETCRLRASLVNIDDGKVEVEGRPMQVSALALRCSELEYPTEAKATEAAANCASHHLGVAAAFRQWIDRTSSRLVDNTEQLAALCNIIEGRLLDLEGERDGLL